MTRKNPAAVALGRKGGAAKSPAKTAAVRANAAKPRGKRREQWYADGWRDAMERAADAFRLWADGHLLDSDADKAHDFADRIAAEPSPKKAASKLACWKCADHPIGATCRCACHEPVAKKEKA